MRMGWIFVAAVGVAGCARVPEVTTPTTGPRIAMALLSAEITEVNFEEGQGELRFQVRNTRPMPVDLDRVEWRLHVAGVETVEGRTYLGAIPSGYDGELIAPIRVPWSQLERSLEANASRSYLPYSLSGEGIFQTPTGEVRRSFQGEGSLPVLHPPNLALEEIQLRSLDPAARSATVDLVLSAQDSQIRSVRNGSVQLHIAGHEVGQSEVGQQWTELSGLVMPMQLDLQGLHPTELQRLSAGGELHTVLHLQGTADTVHGEIPMRLRAEGDTPVTGRPGL